MKRSTQILTVALCALVLGAGAPGWAQDECENLHFWRYGHMEGPHDSSMALGISRDGKTAVGSTLVVDFYRAWRSDIDWAISTEECEPPLFNELKVQEDVGIIAPSEPSAAYAASDMLCEAYIYDLPNLQLDWCGSTPVGTITGGTVSYSIQWLVPVLDGFTEEDFVKIPDFGGGDSDMAATDVSADGFIMVGYGNVKKGPKAFRADMTDPLLPVVKQLTITDAVYTAQTLKWSVAEAVSADGLRIAGYGGTKTGNRAFVTEVVDPDTDPITLLSVVLPKLGGGKWNEAYAMTPDGEVIAGRCDSSKGPQACIWFRVDGNGVFSPGGDFSAEDTWAVKPLGGLSKKKYDSVATGIAYKEGSDAGDLMVVGWSKSILYPSEAFVWAGNPVVEDDEIGYLYDLEYILIKTGVAEQDLMGSQWILNEATGLSALGDRIVGWGVNPEGGVEAWVVTGYPFDTPVFVKE